MKTNTFAGLIILTVLLPAFSAAPAGCPALTRNRFYPAEGQAGRMLHGRFAGSNEGAKTGFEMLAEIKEVPQEHEWSELILAAPMLYRFIKYEAPNGSWGNVAEVEFYAGDQKIHGAPFGTTGSGDNAGRDFAQAMGGDLSTFFDGAEPNNQYVGLDLGGSVQASASEFAPRPGNYPSFYEVHRPIRTTKPLWQKYREKAVKLPKPAARIKIDLTLPVRQVQDNPIYAGLIEELQTRLEADQATEGFGWNATRGSTSCSILRSFSYRARRKS